MLRVVDLNGPLLTELRAMMIRLEVTVSSTKITGQGDRDYFRRFPRPKAFCIARFVGANTTLGPTACPVGWAWQSGLLRLDSSYIGTVAQLVVHPTVKITDKRQWADVAKLEAWLFGGEWARTEMFCPKHVVCRLDYLFADGLDDVLDCPLRTLGDLARTLPYRPKSIPEMLWSYG